MDTPAQPTGRPHSPLIAGVAGLLLPGAGQSYNGAPFRGLFVLLTSVLVLPWLVGAWTATNVARRMRASGGRWGRGGLFWLFLHAWLVFVVALAVLLGLSIWGVAP